jgi:hypothetical protein
LAVLTGFFFVSFFVSFSFAINLPRYAKFCSIKNGFPKKYIYICSLLIFYFFDDK